MKAILRLSRLDKLRHSDHSRINILCLRRNSSSREGQSEAEQRSIRNARDQKERQAAIHTPDTTSVRHTVSLTCQGALANTGQHRGQSPNRRRQPDGARVRKSPFVLFITMPAILNQIKELMHGLYWYFKILPMQYWVLRTVTRTRQAGDAISSTTVLAVKGHASAHGGECFRTRGRTCKWLTCGKICLWPRFTIIILAFR